jgi:hypothetical protein
MAAFFEMRRYLPRCGTCAALLLPLACGRETATLEANQQTLSRATESASAAPPSKETELGTQAEPLVEEGDPSQAPTVQSEEAVRAWVLRTHNGVPPARLSEDELNALLNRLAGADPRAAQALNKDFRKALYAMESADERKIAIERFNRVMNSRQ